MSNKRMRFLRLLGRRITPGADRPYRFVAITVSCNSFGFQPGQAALQLDRQDFLDLAFVALLERFADANDGSQFPFMRRAHFSINDFIRFPKQRAAFAVAEHDVAHKQVAQKRSGDFARKRAAPLPVHILRADLDVLGFA